MFGVLKSFPTALASEYRAWLLFTLFQHFMDFFHRFTIPIQFLVCSLHILLSDCIPQSDLSLPQSALEVFCRDFEKLCYLLGVQNLLHNIVGTDNCTINIHFLHHLTHYRITGNVGVVWAKWPETAIFGDFKIVAWKSMT